jgi:hypothetical protein
MKGRLWSAYFAGTTSMLSLFFVAIGRTLEGVIYCLIALALMMVAFLVYGGDNDSAC